MRKIILDEPSTKAKKRDIKKRQRMKLHGAALKRPSPHAGKSLTTK